MTTPHSPQQPLRVILLVVHVHSQSTDTQAGHLVVGNLEVQPTPHTRLTPSRNRRNLLCDELVRGLLQVEDHLQVVLLLPRHLADHPQHATLLLAVLLHLTLRVRRQRHRARRRVVRRAHRDEHVARVHVGLELGAHLQDQLDLRLGLLLHHRTDRERRLERRRDAVVHRRELALGRVEAQQALRVELVQLHAAVEVDVVQDDEVVRAQRAALRVLHHRDRRVLAHQRVLRQQHAHRGTPAQVRAHRDRAVDRLRHHLAAQVHHAVQALEHVHVQLVHLLLLVAVRDHRLVHVADHVLLSVKHVMKTHLRVRNDHGLVVHVVGEDLARGVLRIAKVLRVNELASAPTIASSSSS